MAKPLTSPLTPPPASSLTSLTSFHQCLGEDWLIGGDSRQFASFVEEYAQILGAIDSGKSSQSACPGTVLLAEADPIRFLAAFLAACQAGHPLFLGNPHWTAAEWRQVIRLAQPDLLLGEGATLDPLEIGDRVSRAKPGWIMIPTGGSSGQIRFAIHTWATLMASVEGFRQYFQVDRVHSCCVLPLYHVSGLMQFLRCFVSGGKLALLPFKQLEVECPNLDPATAFLSLVPTQLQRLLQSPASICWLAQFSAVLLGGGPAWPELLEAARKHQIRLAPTYGMTETASQIVTLKPEEFLQGQTGCGRLLPHAQIILSDPSGHPVAPGEVGIITITAASLALGYYPHLFASTAFQTDDLGVLDQQGYLHLLGRNSQKIITGGENVFPAEIEAVIRASGLVADVCVLGLPDRDWGERVTAVYVPAASTSLSGLQAALQAAVEPLTKYKRPKRWVAIETLPRNAQGKVNQEQLKRLLLEQADSD